MTQTSLLGDKPVNRIGFGGESRPLSHSGACAPKA